MDFFSGLKKYGALYAVVATRMFEESEINQVSTAKIVNSAYGLSVCFYMKTGGMKYVPVSRDSVASVGDEVDLRKAKILTLAREGDEEAINRIEI